MGERIPSEKSTPCEETPPRGIKWGRCRMIYDELNPKYRRLHPESGITGKTIPDQQLIDSQQSQLVQPQMSIESRKEFLRKWAKDFRN